MSTWASSGWKKDGFGERWSRRKKIGEILTNNGGYDKMEN
jgi:hypothetical protein